jgi:hypothetical protein
MLGIMVTCEAGGCIGDAGIGFQTECLPPLIHSAPDSPTGGTGTLRQPQPLCNVM